MYFSRKKCCTNFVQIAKDCSFNDYNISNFPYISYISSVFYYNADHFTQNEDFVGFFVCNIWRFFKKLFVFRETLLFPSCNENSLNAWDWLFISNSYFWDVNSKSKFEPFRVHGWIIWVWKKLQSLVWDWQENPVEIVPLKNLAFCDAMIAITIFINMNEKVLLLISILRLVIYNFS